MEKIVCGRKRNIFSDPFLVCPVYLGNDQYASCFCFLKKRGKEFLFFLLLKKNVSATSSSFSQKKIFLLSFCTPTRSPEHIGDEIQREGKYSLNCSLLIQEEYIEHALVPEEVFQPEPVCNRLHIILGRSILRPDGVFAEGIGEDDNPDHDVLYFLHRPTPLTFFRGDKSSR
jgi:hypothetical protein